MTNLMFAVSINNLSTQLPVREVIDLDTLNNSKLSDLDKTMIFLSSKVRKCIMPNKKIRYFLEDEKSNHIIDETGNTISTINAGEIVVYSNYIIVISNGRQKDDISYISVTKCGNYCDLPGAQLYNFESWKSNFKLANISIYNLDGTPIIENVGTKAFFKYENGTCVIAADSTGERIFISPSGEIKIVEDILDTWFIGPKLLGVKYKSGKINYITQDLVIENTIKSSNYHKTAECKLINSDEYLKEVSKIAKKLENYPNLAAQEYNKNILKTERKIAIAGDLTETFILRDDNSLYKSVVPIITIIEHRDKEFWSSRFFSKLNLLIIQKFCKDYDKMMLSVNIFQDTVLKMRGNPLETFVIKFELIDTVTSKLMGVYIDMLNPVGIHTIVKLEEYNNVFYKL